MRIVYTVLSGRLAGGQMVCLQTMRAARTRGHEVCLSTPSEGELTDIAADEGIPVFIHPMGRTYHLHRAVLFAAFLRKWEADLVHCHGAVVEAIMARLGAAMAGVPLISHVHIENKFSDRAWVRRFQVGLDNFSARFADEIIAISESTRASLVAQGIPGDRVRVVPNGVAIPEKAWSGGSDALRDETGIPEDHVIVGTVARLCPVKGQREFLLAAQQVVRQRPSTSFVIVGEDLEFGGSYRRELEDLAEALGITGNVVFLGFRRDAAELMTAFDVFVLPSWTEGMPLTILEAMARAKPVIATPVGGVPEIVREEETGSLTPANDPDGLAAVMLRYVDDSELRRRTGLAGRALVVQRFSADSMLDEVLRLYEKTAA